MATKKVEEKKSKKKVIARGGESYDYLSRVNITLLIGPIR